MARTLNAKIVTAKRQIDRLWKLCCKHDNVEPSGMFVVFSKSNPHQPAYQKAMSKLLRLLEQKATA